MGLIKNNCYIRLTLDGTYYIYKTKKDRLAEKKATPRDLIINKYREIIWGLRFDQEAIYYQETPQVLQDWNEEFKAYVQKDSSNKFPLMKTYIKDVSKSIPQILGSGRLSVKGNTLEEVYNYVKEFKIFGDTEDDL